MSDETFTFREALEKANGNVDKAIEFYFLLSLVDEVGNGKAIIDFNKFYEGDKVSWESLEKVARLASQFNECDTTFLVYNVPSELHSYVHWFVQFFFYLESFGGDRKPENLDSILKSPFSMFDFDTEDVTVKYSCIC